MKIIIDIPEETYKCIAKIADAEKEPLGYFERVIMRGVPLDDVKEEIDKAYDSLPRYYPFALNTFAIMVGEILDSA